MELAVILVLLVVAELAITCFLLGRIKDYKHTLDDVIDNMANIEHGLDQALASLGLAQQSIGKVQNGVNDYTDAIASAAQVAQGATPDEVEQAKHVLQSLGIKMD